MEKESLGSSDGRQRPFYELPSHIKPCSRIIQETRMQLKYSKKVPMRDLGVADMTPLPLSDTGKGNTYEGVKTTMGYVKPINTQRPFTPRDNVSLWGVSSRKRPPSAITLSRLTMPSEDVEESRSGSSTSSNSNSGSKTLPMNTFGNIGPSSKYSATGKARSIEPKHSLGSFSSHSSSLAGIEESDTDDTCIDNEPSTGRCSAEAVGNVDKARLQMKSLSLQNVTSRTPTSFQQKQASWTLGSISGNEGRGDYSVRDSLTFSKKARHSDTDNDKIRDNGDGVEERNRRLLTNGYGMEVETAVETHNGQVEDPYQHINNLEVAIEYLRSFVMECANSEKPPKADIISILQKIREKLYHDEVCFDEALFSKLRKKLLELIFKLVEKNQNDEDILFWSSFVLLHCDIIGNNLTTVFKMVFKSSRYKEYNDIILDSEYLEVLMKSFSQICPKTQTESMIYGYGTLKFICGDNSVLNRVIDLNLIPIMALHLKILNCEIEILRDSSSSKISDGILNGIFQLTSILRSVVGEERALIWVVQSGLLEELCTTLTWAMDDIDVLTNIVRILSVVSMDSVCCQIMYNNETFCPTIVRVLKLWCSKDDVMVRVAFCLGNLLANSDDMRIKLFEEPEAFQNVLKVMSHYLDKSSPGPVSIDILIKITRVLANWILNPFVGSEICDNHLLSELLYLTLQIKESPKELTLCVMCTLNNTSFYINYMNLNEGTLKTAEYIFQNILKQQLEVRSEAVKVLGNLTRNTDVRLMASKYMEHILSSLDEEASVELICATLGVLINVVIEESVKSEFLRKKGVERVIRVLEKNNDMMVSLISCQVIWNLLISHENQGLDLNMCISLNEKMHLKKILTEKLENEQNSKSCNETSAEFNNHHEEGVPFNSNSAFELFSEDFNVVAKDLVKKL